MISNRNSQNSLLVLSSNNLYSFKSELKEELGNSNKNQNIVVELSLNEDNENYGLGYN
jgi:hypothetical protein